MVKSRQRTGNSMLFHDCKSVLKLQIKKIGFASEVCVVTAEIFGAHQVY